ncbi:MAG: rhomboid family intramembrane serine protease [Pseudomonadota bacterium]
MFLPLHDGKPVKTIHLQWVTLSIIGLNVLVYLAVNVIGVAGADKLEFAARAFGHVPSVSNDLKVLPEPYRVIPDHLYVLSTLTSAFLHADFFHLLGNMLFIWVFGDNVEDALGHIKFALFYILSAFAAASFHAFVFSTSDSPLIGASGAAAGIVGAYLMLHPKMQIWILFLSRIPLRLPAWTVLGGWVGFQVFMFVVDTDGQISWAAHVGGAAAGVLLVLVLRRRGVPLFDREIVVPDAVELTDRPSLPPNVKPPRNPWGRNASR